MAPLPLSPAAQHHKLSFIHSFINLLHFFLQPKILIVDDLGTSQPEGLVQMTAPNDVLISLPKENKPGLVKL